MQTLSERPAESAGAISSGLAIQQRERETSLQVLARLRKEAFAEIERLIAFLDACDPYAANELEPSLGWPTSGVPLAINDGGDDPEHDEADDEDGRDDEPSLGSHEIRPAAHRPVVGGGEVYIDCEEEHDGREEETFRCF